jgi:DNA (cytosine-5)-methyltransferase 1
VNYYNDNDPYCCEWLENLIQAGELPAGIVDRRLIQEVSPDELRGYTQAHFFAGIGGWSLALRLAGWSPDAVVWTGSAPCQPLSCAGKRRGHEDERHLWPAWFRLIRECRPSVVFGEQVASRDGLEWLDGVFADLEDAGYACGAADLCAAGCGAPHIRQRLYWVAESKSHGYMQRIHRNETSEKRENYCGRKSQGVRFADTSDGGEVDGLADLPESGPQGSSQCYQARAEDVLIRRDGWSGYRIIPCRDGKARRVSAQSGDEPLAHGIPRDLRPLQSTLERMGFSTKEARRMLRRPRSLLALAGRNRVGRLRGYGNAIVPQVAALFVRAYMEATE